MKGYLGLVIVLPILLVAKVVTVFTEVATEVAGRAVGWIYRVMISA